MRDSARVRGLLPGRVRVLRVGVSESGGAGDEARLRAIGDLELGEDAGDVVADGLLAEEEACGDLGVAPSLGEQLEYFELAFGELREGVAGVGGWRCGEVALQPGCDAWAENCLAVGDGADRSQCLVFGLLL